MRQLLLGLTITPGVGWKTIYNLLQRGLDRSAFGLSPTQWKTSFPDLTDKQVRSLNETMQKEKVSHYEKQLEKDGISCLIITDEAYPPLLKEMFQPPWLLFAKGDLSLLEEPCLAVVGSRKSSSYGQRVARQFVPQLCQEGFAIVSGLALGIDALAHLEALQSSGKTIGVLGGGIDVIYPERNRHLYHRLADEGLLLSEYPPQTKPMPGFFPQRNRIIAGLSYGVLVVEAAEKSGALITAHFALEYGREVFALPGSIYSEQSQGTNLLIQRHGAKLITCVADITDELKHVLPDGKHKETNQEAGLKAENIVDDKERALLQLFNDERVHINELHRRSGLSLTELHHLLLNLELKNWVVSLPGSYYERQSKV